jgi:tRNA threonylcarbamoyladenosine biosynthesis protein TsaE
LSREGTSISGNELTITTRSPEETIALGRRLGALLEPNDVVALIGELGAGKTCLTKGIALGLGLSDARAVRSPTFVLVSEYKGRLTLYHVDAYRLSGAADFDALGASEMMNSGGVTVIEWADRVEGVLPAECLRVACCHAGEKSRAFLIFGRGRRAEAVLAAMAEN